MKSACYRANLPHCVAKHTNPKLCEGWQGRRKYITRPEKTLSATTHTASVIGQKKHLNTDDGHLKQWWSWLGNEFGNCINKINTPTVIEKKLIRDDDLSNWLDKILAQRKIHVIYRYYELSFLITFPSFKTLKVHF